MFPVKHTNHSIAFLGLGVMGTPMALNIARSGYQIQAFDTFPAARDRGREQGLDVTEDIAGLLSRASVVITMLPYTEHVEHVIHGEHGILAHCRPGALHVDMSSISPVATRAFGAASAAAGIAYVDAPVSGGVKGAIGGNLSIMAGGDPEHIEASRGILETMSSTITHMGPVGAGQATKVCNQVGVAITIQAACEAFALGSKLGVDLEQLRKALLGGATSSWVLENLGPQMISGDDSAGFRIALQVKDLNLALEAAREEGMPLPAAAGVMNMYLEAVAHGEADNGNQALSRVYERLSNTVIGERRETGPSAVV